MADEQTILEGRVFRVVRFGVTDRDGHEHPYEVVRHPGAAAIVPWLPDGRVLLIEQPRPATGRTLLEIPAGTLDPGEAPETCAARELEEETGWRAGTLRPLIRFYPTPGICDELMWLFEARDLSAGTAAPDPDEQITCVPTAPEHVAALVRDGAIADAKTLVGLALAGVPVPAPGW